MAFEFRSQKKKEYDLVIHIISNTIKRELKEWLMFMNYYSKLFCWTIFTIQKAPYNQILPQSNEIQGLLLAAHIKRKVLLQLEGEPAIQTN